MAAAPELVAIAVLLAGLLALSLYFASRALTQILRDFPIPGIPLVGSAIRHAMDALADWIDDRVAGLAKSGQKMVAKTIAAFADGAYLAAHNIRAYAYAVEHAIEHLFTTHTTTVVRVSSKELQKQIDAINAAVKSINAAVANLKSETGTKIKSLRTDITNTVYKPLHESIANVSHSLDATAYRLTHKAILPLEHVIDTEIPNIRIRLGDVERTLDGIPVKYVVSGAAAGTAALALVNALGFDDTAGAKKCGRKLRGMCGLDPSIWGDMLEGLTELAIAFSLLDLVHEAQEFAPAINAAMSEIAKV
jgi:phage-related tail protein